MRNLKKGSITIETAIACSVVILFIASVINFTVVYRTDILMGRALEQTCEDFMVFPPFTISASDTLSTLVNALPDDQGGDIGSNIGKIITFVTGFDSGTSNLLTNIGVDFMLSRRFENDIMQGYIERNNGSDFFAPDYLDVEFELKSESNYLGVYLRYEIYIITGPVERCLYSVIPLYGEWDPYLNGNNGSDESESDIWSEGNFSRGRHFQELFGANLPSTFPVIARFDGDTATSITSIDLTSPYYQDQSALDDRITDEIESLSAFNGANVIINGQEYSISPSEIRKRDLVVIIPENSPDEARALIQDNIGYAASLGINMRIEEYGNSRHYEE